MMWIYAPGVTRSTKKSVPWNTAVVGPPLTSAVDVVHEDMKSARPYILLYHRIAFGVVLVLSGREMNGLSC